MALKPSIDRFLRVQYMGDSVYAGHDGFQVWIWTSNGLNESSQAIALEPETLEALVQYDKQFRIK